MTDEPLDSAWAVLKRDEPFGPASRSQRPYGPISPEDLRRLQLQALRRMQALNPEEQKRAEIEAANAEARRRIQERNMAPFTQAEIDEVKSEMYDYGWDYGPGEMEAELLRRLQERQAPKISNYMADSAQSMAQNNPTANLAHSSGNLPGVPLPDTEPLDLSMESLRENQE